MVPRSAVSLGKARLTPRAPGLQAGLLSLSDLRGDVSAEPRFLLPG